MTTPAPSGTDRPDDLLRLAALVLANRRVVFGYPFLVAVMAVAIGLLLPRKYTARAAFVPQAPASSLSRLAGLAAQFGVGLPGQDQALSPEFYAELVHSEQLRRALVDSIYVVRKDGEEVRQDLVAYYGITKPTPELGREAAVRRLGKDLSVRVGLKTGIVEVKLTSRHAELSLAVMERALALLNEFNLQTRQSRAAAEREFTEGRVGQARTELREAEDRLQRFLSQNREFRNSPQLSFEHDRLQREVSTRQEVYTSMVQAYEQARIEEVRNTPVITVVERPVLPVRPDSRLLAVKAVMVLIIGGFVGLLVALSRARMAGGDGLDVDPRLALRSEWSAVRQEMRRPWRLFGVGR